MPEDVCILAFGMISAVGLTAREMIASVRAGTARFGQSPRRDKAFEPFNVAEVPAKGLPPLNEELSREPLSTREARLLRLATAPLAEAGKMLAKNPLKPPLFLALPECETRVPLDKARFLKSLARQAGGFNPVTSQAEFIGRAGGLSAVGAAWRAVSEGKSPFALAGGVDSLLDLYVLATLDMEQRIKSNTSWDAFIPGEGAAFLLLGSKAGADSLKAKPLATLSGVAHGTEAGHLYSTEPYRGEGLAQAVTELFKASAPPKPVSATYSSMNGESHWGKEYSIAYMRNSAKFDPAARLMHPADCYGDIGAAAGPMLAALAADGIAQGYRPGPALVCCSNDRAPRAAMMVL